MSDKRPVEKDAQETQQPVITKEIAEQLIQEGIELARRYRRRIEAMWNISSERRLMRSR
jgi:hypothetical protein